MSHKIAKSLVVFCIPVIFFLYPLVGQEKISEKVDRFLDSMMATESISNPYYEHYDISPDGNWVAFTIARSFQEDDIYPIGDLRKLLGRYFGEGHVLSKPANIRDSWHRIVAWFDKFLKPELIPDPE